MILLTKIKQVGTESVSNLNTIPLPTLKLGTKAAEVGNWQRFLNFRNIKDATGNALTDDENFGPKSEQATKNYQKFIKEPATGIVDLKTRKFAAVDGFIPFIQAKNYQEIIPTTTPSGVTKRVKRKIRLIVLHTMENNEKPYAAEDVAMWFADRSPSKFPAPMASAHYCIDEDSIVQCVREREIAYHAPGANNDGIGIEHSGFAKQTKENWDDLSSRLILIRSQIIASDICLRENIPAKKLTVQEILNGEKGFCGHKDITDAYKKGTHWDPGPNFPWDSYISKIVKLITPSPSP